MSETSWFRSGDVFPLNVPEGRGTDRRILSGRRIDRVELSKEFPIGRFWSL